MQFKKTHHPLHGKLKLTCELLAVSAQPYPWDADEYMYSNG